jgi:hypothetical protein
MSVAFRNGMPQKHRRDEKKCFFKRNRHGQPLMRYRIEKILLELQHGKKGKPAVPTLTH